jgi:hypothetical protein
MCWALQHVLKCSRFEGILCYYGRSSVTARISSRPAPVSLGTRTCTGNCDRRSQDRLLYFLRVHRCAMPKRGRLRNKGEGVGFHLLFLLDTVRKKSKSTRLHRTTFAMPKTAKCILNERPWPSFYLPFFSTDPFRLILFYRIVW